MLLLFVNVIIGTIVIFVSATHVCVAATAAAIAVIAVSFYDVSVVIYVTAAAAVGGAADVIVIIVVVAALAVVGTDVAVVFDAATAHFAVALATAVSARGVTTVCGVFGTMVLLV